MQITNTVQRNKQRLIWAAYVFASLFSLWIRAGFPVFGIPASPHDDALFQHLARNLLMGEWLGEYNNLTLAKGMFYPFFISASAVAGLPLKMAEHLLYLGCALLAARYFVRVTGREIAGLALFVLLAFNPFLWTEEMARVMREGIYLSLSMALLILSFALLLPSENSSSGRIGIAAKALITGIVAGFYWLTREEGMWLAPALATLFIFAFAHQWQKLGLRQTASGTLPKAIVLVMLVFCVVVGGVRYETGGTIKSSRQRSFMPLLFLEPMALLSGFIKMHRGVM